MTCKKSFEYPIVAFVALILVCFEATARAENMEASVYAVTGLAEFAPPHSASYTPLRVGQELEVGSAVRTGPDSKVCLRATPGSALIVGSNSLIRINELAFASTSGEVTERKARLRLTSGVVSALIDPRNPKVTDFRIQTPQGAATARGTFYMVVVRDGETYVKTDEGKVAAVAMRVRGTL